MKYKTKNKNIVIYDLLSSLESGTLVINENPSDQTYLTIQRFESGIKQPSLYAAIYEGVMYVQGNTILDPLISKFRDIKYKKVDKSDPLVYEENVKLFNKLSSTTINFIVLKCDNYTYTEINNFCQLTGISIKL